MAPTTTQTSPAESAILSRLVTGDEQALGELYDLYGALAYSLACSLVSESADAEEVVADAFGQIWRTAATYDAERGNVLAWLTTIVRSRALDLLRSQRRRAKALEVAAAQSPEESPPGMSSSSAPADRGAELSEARTLVRRSLRELPEPQRVVLELAYFGGLSQSEIADRLREPLGTVKTRMRAGLEKLRQALKPLTEVSP